MLTFELTVYKMMRDSDVEVCGLPDSIQWNRLQAKDFAIKHAELIWDADIGTWQELAKDQCEALVRIISLVDGIRFQCTLRKLHHPMTND